MLKKFSKLLRNLQRRCNTLTPPREFHSQRGQGIVEYGLIIGFVAIIAIFILNGSHLKENVDQNIKNANTVASTMDAKFKDAKGTQDTGTGGDNTGSDVVEPGEPDEPAG